MNKKENQRRIGILLTYTGQIVQLLTGLLYTPIMLRLLGQSEYGLYTLVNSVVSYLGLLSFGFSGSYMRFYSRYKAKNDTEAIARLNGMFLTIFSVISLICLLCGGVIIGNIESIFGSGLEPLEYQKARVLMSIMVINLAMTFPLSVFDSNIVAHEQFVFQKLIVLLQHFLNPFISFPLLLLGYGSVSLVCVTTGLTVLKAVACIFFCRKKLEIKFFFRGFHFSLLKEMWVFTFFIFINSIIDQINWNIGKLLIGRILGTASVAVFGVASQLNGLYMNFSTAVSNVYVPEVNRIVAEDNDNAELTRLFIRVGRIQFMIVVLIMSGFIFFGREFIYFWAGKNYEEAYVSALLLMIPVTVPLIQNLGIEIQRAKNKHQARGIVYLIMAFVNLAITVPLINLWGVIGAAFGTTLALIGGNIVFMNWYYHNYIGLDIIAFWKEIRGLLPAFFIPGVCGGIFVKVVNLYDPVCFVICIGVYIGIYIISIWKFGMNTEEKMVARTFFRKNT